MNALLQGRYEIIEMLSDAGGFGETFLAVDRQLPSQRKVVIKKFRPKQRLEPRTYEIIRERFEREAAVLEALSEVSRYVPKLYAFFSEAGDHYLVQEFIEGQTLGQFVRAHGRLDEMTTRKLLTELLEALHEVHAQGIIHRDIKPDNILLRASTGQPVLIDFGAVKEVITTVLDAYGTPQRASLIIGTPGYTPAEQSVGRPVYASDLYSLAMTMIFALTGREPRDLNDLASGELHWQAHTDKLSQLLTALLDRAIQYDYRERFKNAREMREALSVAFLLPDPIKPNPQSAPSRPTVVVDPATVPRPVAPPPPPHIEPTMPEPVVPRTAVMPTKETSGLPKPWKALLALGLVGSLSGAIYWASGVNAPATSASIQQGVAMPATPTSKTRQMVVVLPGQDFTETINGVKLEMKAIPAGSFLMGSPETEAGHDNNESPQHLVSVPAFAMGKYEITQAQWQAVMGVENNQYYKGESLPVVDVSWDEVKEFCQKLSQMTGKSYRLPSEAEWEYSARAGTRTPFAFGSKLLLTQGNFDGSKTVEDIYRRQLKNVGSFKANAFGLFDMHGNVWEWCEDVWHDNFNGAPPDGSSWLDSEKPWLRVLRGGSYIYPLKDSRSASRSPLQQGMSNHFDVGFRVAVSAQSP